MMTTLSVTLLFLYFVSSNYAASEVIPPESKTVMLGKEAKFNCAYTENTYKGISWSVNNKSIYLLGIQSTEQPEDGGLASTLTIIGSAQYDNASIQCSLRVSLNTNFPLELVFLTVLGIGPVHFIKIVKATNSSHFFVQWEKPMFVSSDVTDLMYNVLVSGEDLSPFHVTTNETECCHDMLTPCQVYNITITPTSPNYVGATNGTEDAIDGDNYRLERVEDYCMLSKVEFMDDGSVTCSFVCKVDIPQVPCPDQCLHMLTTAENNESVNGTLSTTSTVCFDTQEMTETTVMINVAGLHAAEQYHSNFSIRDHNGTVIDRGKESVSFRTYSVQDAAFSQLPSANIVNVTCYFATNAVASACMARFENASLVLAFNGTVDHPHGLLNSFGNVTIPKEVFQQGETRVTFDVKVFDVDEDRSIPDEPAFEQNGAVELVLRVDVNGAEPNPDSSTHATGASASTNPSVSSSVKSSSTYIIAILVPALSVLIVLIVFMVLVVVLLRYCRQKKRRCSVKFKNQAHPGLQHDVPTDKDSPRAEGSGPHVSLPLYPLQTPSNLFSEPKPGDTCENGYPLPSNAQSSPLELDGEMVEHLEGKKDGVVYAELGSRPANGPPVLPPDTSVHYMTVKGSHGAEGSGADADHATSVGEEETPHSPQSTLTPSSSYSPEKKELRPNPANFQCKDGHPQPSNAPSSPLELDRKEVEHVENKKDGVVDAELGSRPANAPVVLPPDTSVHYTTVKSSHGAEGSVGGEDLLHSQQSAPTSCYAYPTIKQPMPNFEDGQCEKIDSRLSNAQSSLQGKKDGVMYMYADLGPRPANAPVVLPPDTNVHYMTVNTRPKDMGSHGAEGGGLDFADHAAFIGDEETLHSLQSTNSPEKEQLRPNSGSFQGKNVCPHPLNAQSSPLPLDAEMVEHLEGNKDAMVYAELGSRPASAPPPVLPPDTSVQYMTVNQTPVIPKNMESPLIKLTDVTTASVDSGTEQCTPAYEDISIEQPQVNSSTGESLDASLARHLLDTPKIFPESDRVEYKQIKKNAVEYAEPEAKPANPPGMHMNDHEYCLEQVKKMALESTTITENEEDLVSTPSPHFDPEKFSLCTTFKIDSVPSYAWKSNDKKERNCFESLETPENETQRCNLEVTYGNQSEESGHKMDSGGVDVPTVL